MKSKKSKKNSILGKIQKRRHNEYIQQTLDYLQYKTRAWARGENVVWNIPSEPMFLPIYLKKPKKGV